jgi:hypothetical protein
MNSGQNLFDIIGVLIGFVTVMLLLSLVVTGLVQAIQAGIRLRARNLKKGLEALLETVIGESKANKNIAAEILNANNFLVIGKRKDPDSFISRLKGSIVSYVDPQQLFKLLHTKLASHKDLNKEIFSKINDYWKVLELQMEKQFLKYIRIITIVCALAVAFYFQVSAPDLLNKLSIDSEYRAKIVAEAVKLTDESGEKPKLILNYQDVSLLALADVEEKYPNVKEALEEVSASGKTKSELLGELDDVLADKIPDVAEVKKYYEQRLDKRYEEEGERAQEQIQRATDMLGQFQINGWQYGWAFYTKNKAIQWKNIIGVIITMILLTFGAPFWFEQLKNLMKLKDTLSKGIKEEEKKEGSEKK